MSEWISIKQESPFFPGLYLVFEDDCYSLAIYVPSGKKWMDTQHNNFIHPTHWMELPDNPDEPEE